MISETQAQILDVAEQRFADYGYNKTTMAEIAADCGMSVGNLYRHFDNKSAIAAASMQRFLDLKLQKGQEAAAAETSACSKLSAFLLARLELSHARVVDSRHLHELIQTIDSQHSQLLLQQEQKVIEAMAAILKEGIAAGYIIQLDAHRTAHLLHQALLRYNHPISLKRNSLEQLEKDLRDTLALFYSGISRQGGSA